MSESLTDKELNYLKRGAKNPTGKLPIFDKDGGLIPAVQVEKCLQKGLAEAWFRNPMQPSWLVCKITEAGRRALTSPSE